MAGSIFEYNAAINQAQSAASFRNSLNNRATFEQEAARKRLINQQSGANNQSTRSQANETSRERNLQQQQVHSANVAANRAFSLQSKLTSSSGSGNASAAQDRAIAAQAAGQDKSISAADRARAESLAAQSAARGETLAAQDRARGESLAASDRSRKETLAAQAAGQDKSISAADRARADTIAAQDRGRREGLEGSSRLQSERFTQTSKLQEQSAAEAQSNKQGDRAAAMQAFMRFRKGA